MTSDADDSSASFELSSLDVGVAEITVGVVGVGDGVVAVVGVGDGVVAVAGVGDGVVAVVSVGDGVVAVEGVGDGVVVGVGFGDGVGSVRVDASDNCSWDDSETSCEDSALDWDDPSRHLIAESVLSAR